MKNVKFPSRSDLVLLSDDCAAPAMAQSAIITSPSLIYLDPNRLR